MRDCQQHVGQVRAAACESQDVAQAGVESCQVRGVLITRSRIRLYIFASESVGVQTCTMMRSCVYMCVHECMFMQALQWLHCCQHLSGADPVFPS